jgi:molybdenum-dependent DNA-binding transcriptional regulator ModE
MMTTISCHQGEQMKLHQLQALIASAETGSIRAAARSLEISQAAVTKALRELETSQQLPLFTRTASEFHRIRQSAADSRPAGDQATGARTDRA